MLQRWGVFEGGKGKGKAFHHSHQKREDLWHELTTAFEEGGDDDDDGAFEEDSFDDVLPAKRIGGNGKGRDVTPASDSANSRSKRYLTERLHNVSVVEYLDTGKWYLFIYNDGLAINQVSSSLPVLVG